MKITFLGTGTSQGVPVIACHCEVCSSSDPCDSRLRTSILIEHNQNNFVVDTGPDFRQQMLRSRVDHVEALLFTHEHKDHVAGLDDVRAFNFKHNRHMPIYATEFVQQTLKREFLYAFAHDLYPGAPLLKLQTIEAGKIFEVNGTDILPIEVLHGKLPVMAFRIGDFTYITDANRIPDASKQLMKGTKTLVLNALRHHSHHSHFTLEEAIAVSKEIGAEKTYFTHISHLLGKHSEVQSSLPPNMWLAYDGLCIEV